MNRFMTALFSAALFMFASSVSAFEVTGLAVPESFIVDPSTGNYYISNINGQPLDKNGNGFITRLNPDGSVGQLKFIDGTRSGVTLNAPKGLLIRGGTLYVSDIDHVRAFDKISGAPVGDIDLTSFKPKFLNDLAMDKRGKLYISDMGTNRLFAVDTSKGYKASVLVSDKRLASPNGIRFHKKRNGLVVATWDSGEIFHIDLTGKIRPFMKTKLDTGLDGVDFDDEGNLYVSSFTGGKVFRVNKRGRVDVLASGLVTPADISLDRKKRLVLVPSFNGNRAFTLDY